MTLPLSEHMVYCLFPSLSHLALAILVSSVFSEPKLLPTSESVRLLG